MINNIRVFLFSVSCFSFITQMNAKDFSPSAYSQQKAIDTAFQVAGQVGIHGVNVLLEKNGITLPSQEAQTKYHEVQTELGEINISEAKIKKLNEQFEVSNKFFSLPGKKNSKEGNRLLKRIEKQLDEVTKDLPTLTEEEEKEINPETPKQKEQVHQEKVSLFKKATASFAVACTAAGQMADFLASYSFAHLTNLDCFKGTFIETNAKEINRFLVATTIVGISCIAYKTYKALHKDDDSFFDNDAEE